MLSLKDVQELLKNDYLPIETGYGLTKDNMAHVCVSTYMSRCNSKMIEWWFGFIFTTEQYKWWHPLDHISSDWEGLRNNDSTYINGHHLVEEYLGDRSTGIKPEKLKISFKDPSQYFGINWKEDFEYHGYQTAICGRTFGWDEKENKYIGQGHLIHLIKDDKELEGCRMRSRFWLGDIEGIEENLGPLIPEKMLIGLMKHATEEMSILSSKLPELYEKYRRQ